MRLICPNCGAQYEVDDSVIPENGRDVQCSNCGHTWYQRSANSNADGTKEVVETPADLPEQDQLNGENPAVVDIELPEEPTETTPKPRELDNDAASILRQEADREITERSNKTPVLETQPDLGLTEPEEISDDGIQKKMARLRGLDDDHGAAIAAAAIGQGPRKNLLPDIEELNSTLTASADAPEEEMDEATQDTKRSSGFRRAFAITILFFTILVIIYIFAPQIAEKLPQAKDALAAYVDWVNALRQSVDDIMQKAVEKLTALVAQIGGDGSEM